MKLRKWKKIGRKNKKREQKFSGNKKEEEKVGSRIRRNFRRIKNLFVLILEQVLHTSSALILHQLFIAGIKLKLKIIEFFRVMKRYFVHIAGIFTISAIETH